MRPPEDGRAIAILLERVPEFESAYLDLLDIYDEDLTAQVVFNELAEFVTALFEDAEDEEVLEGCFEALERVASQPGGEGTTLVAFCFFDHLSSTALETARSYLHPVSETILELLDEDLIADDDECERLLSERLSRRRGTARS